MRSSTFTVMPAVGFLLGVLAIAILCVYGVATP